MFQKKIKRISKIQIAVKAWLKTVMRIDTARERPKEVFFSQLPNLETRRRYART